MRWSYSLAIRRGHRRGAGRKFILEKQSPHMPQGGHMKEALREKTQQSRQKQRKERRQRRERDTEWEKNKGTWGQVPLLDVEVICRSKGQEAISLVRVSVTSPQSGEAKRNLWQGRCTGSLFSEISCSLILSHFIWTISFFHIYCSIVLNFDSYQSWLFCKGVLVVSFQFTEARLLQPLSTLLWAPCTHLVLPVRLDKNPSQLQLRSLLVSCGFQCVTCWPFYTFVLRSSHSLFAHPAQMLVTLIPQRTCRFWQFVSTLLNFGVCGDNLSLVNVFHGFVVFLFNLFLYGELRRLKNLCSHITVFPEFPSGTV